MEICNLPIDHLDLPADCSTALPESRSSVTFTWQQHCQLHVTDATFSVGLWNTIKNALQIWSIFDCITTAMMLQVQQMQCCHANDILWLNTTNTQPWVPHPSSQSTNKFGPNYTLDKFHVCISNGCDAIMLRQLNKHRNSCLDLQQLVYYKACPRTTFSFVDTQKQACTHRQVDRRLTTITAFTITAGKQWNVILLSQI